MNESEASGGFSDVASGQVWPGVLFDVDAGPEDADLDDTARWLLVPGLGPSVSSTHCNVTATSSRAGTATATNAATMKAAPDLLM